jgi:hypothetical protein
VLPDGSLRLTSDGGEFGENGAYVVVGAADGYHAARVPIYETFRVYVDDEAVLRTDHVLRLWSATGASPALQAQPRSPLGRWSRLIGPGPSTNSRRNTQL